MKAKICAEMVRLKQRTDTQVGKDKTIDDIALELEEVDKQIRLLTDAIKNKNNKKINIIKKLEPEPPEPPIVVCKQPISSPLVTNSRRDEFNI